VYAKRLVSSLHARSPAVHMKRCESEENMNKMVGDGLKVERAGGSIRLAHTVSLFLEK